MRAVPDHTAMISKTAEISFLTFKGLLLKADMVKVVGEGWLCFGC